MRGAKSSKRRVALAAARANALKLDWSGAYLPPRPRLLGGALPVSFPLADLAPYIDWSPFFAAWELTGRFPAILNDEKFGPAARALFADAQAMLQRIIEGNWMAARGVAGFWPANRDGDDILIYADEARRTAVATLHTLRQQLARRDGRANVALADFIAPRASGIADYVGAFIVTAGIGEDGSRTASRAPMTTTPPSWSRRLRTGWRKPLPSACTPRCAASCGAMPPTRRSAPKDLDRRDLSRHPPGARLSGAARPYREGGAVPDSWTAKPRPASR